MKTTVWYLLVICLIKVKEMVNYIFAMGPLNVQVQVQSMYMYMAQGRIIASLQLQVCNSGL